ncbi:Nuclear factor NF-kappa-B p105 subunit, partial [Stegodyphus mimosarum]
MQLWFYEEEAGEVIWECESRFSSNDVFKNVGLSCRVPRYHDINIQSYKDIFIQFRDENRIGPPRCFRYLPINKDSSVVRRKKFRIGATGLNNTERNEPIAVPRMIRKPAKTKEKNMTEQTAIDILRSSFDPYSSISSTTLYTSAATENNGTTISHPTRPSENITTEQNFVADFRKDFESCSSVSLTRAAIGNNEETDTGVLKTTLDPYSSISLTAVHDIAARKEHEMDFDRSLNIFDILCSSAALANLDAELTQRWRENPCEMTSETSQLAVLSDDTLQDTLGSMNNSMEQLSISGPEDIFETGSECMNLPTNLSETIYDSS